MLVSGYSEQVTQTMQRFPLVLKPYSSRLLDTALEKAVRDAPERQARTSG